MNLGFKPFRSGIVTMLTIDQVLTLTIFVTSVALIVFRALPETLASLIGAGLMVLLGLAPFDKALGEFIDWNIIAILLGMWIITSYMVESGIPYILISNVGKRARTYEVFIILLSFLAGFISMFVDNVLVVLLFAPIVVETAKSLGKSPVYGVLLVSLSANFMGTALLLGDLPPQMLHSIVGFEFIDFIVHEGKPSSFPILTLSFTLTLLIFYKFFSGKTSANITSYNVLRARRVNYRLAKVSSCFFILTIILMSLRRELSLALRAYLQQLTGFHDLKLGLITLSMAILLGLTVELLRAMEKVKGPSFDVVLKNIQWDAVLFYSSLFILAKTLEYKGLLQLLATFLENVFTGRTLIATTFLYWVTAPLVAFIEHDAYILTILLTLKELVEKSVLANPSPLYWALVWAGTLGSNYTIVGAPALYVALTILRSKGYRVGLRKFYSITIPYATISLILTYIIALPLWFM